LGLAGGPAGNLAGEEGDRKKGENEPPIQVHEAFLLSSQALLGLS
jgi:hypothetical protein